jgi:hypothetical protein
MGNIYPASAIVDRLQIGVECLTTEVSGFFVFLPIQVFPQSADSFREKNELG